MSIGPAFYRSKFKNVLLNYFLMNSMKTGFEPCQALVENGAVVTGVDVDTQVDFA